MKLPTTMLVGCVDQLDVKFTILGMLLVPYSANRAE